MGRWFKVDRRLLKMNQKTNAVKKGALGADFLCIYFPKAVIENVAMPARFTPFGKVLLCRRICEHMYLHAHTHIQSHVRTHKCTYASAIAKKMKHKISLDGSCT